MELHKLDVVVAGHYSPECVEGVFRTSRVLCILGRPVGLGMGRWGSRKDHSASERSLWYAFLMLGILPSECLSTPFQTVS